MSNTGIESINGISDSILLVTTACQRRGPKIGWSGVERGVCVAENDGAGAERGAGTERGAS